MPTVTFIEHNGTEHRVTFEVGQSAMQAATFAGVPGITADCGGACACATCHTYVEETWLARFPALEEAEDAMLESAVERRPNSRLSCQLVLSEAMDGLTLRLPESQF